MIDHLALQVDDPTAAAAFYVRVFASLNISEAMRYERPEGLVVGLAGVEAVHPTFAGR